MQLFNKIARKKKKLNSNVVFFPCHILNYPQLFLD